MTEFEFTKLEIETLRFILSSIKDLEMGYTGNLQLQNINGELIAT